jgi:hypothetical protein
LFPLYLRWSWASLISLVDAENYKKGIRLVGERRLPLFLLKSFGAIEIRRKSGFSGVAAAV